MDRRELLASMGGLLAVAVGGATGAPALAGGPGVTAWLADQDRRRTALGGLRLPPQVVDHLARQGLRSGLLGDAFGALAGVAGFRDLPRDVQEDPRVRARLDRDGETLGRALLDVTAYLERMPAQERRDRGRTLRDDPALAELLDDGLRAEGRARGADPRRLNQLSRVLSRVTWRLGRQEPGLLIDDCIDTVDRLTARVGLDRHGATVQAADWSPVARDTVPSAMTPQERQELRVSGEIIKHVGQLVCLFGILIGGASVGAAFVLSAGIYILGITAAALILVVGLVLIIIGAFMNNP